MFGRVAPRWRVDQITKPTLCLTSSPRQRKGSKPYKQCTRIVIFLARPASSRVATRAPSLEPDWHRERSRHLHPVPYKSGRWGGYPKITPKTLTYKKRLPPSTGKHCQLLRDVLLPVFICGTPTKVAEWQNERLPSDQISIENGGIITQCQRWPLMIDPQLQGIR